MDTGLSLAKSLHPVHLMNPMFWYSFRLLLLHSVVCLPNNPLDICKVCPSDFLRKEQMKAKKVDENVEN